MSCFLSVNRVELILSKGCIIRTLHNFVKFSITLQLSIFLGNSVAVVRTALEIPITKLRLLALKHESIVYSILFREIILIVEVPETILLIFTLHLLYLSPQISDLILIFVLFANTILINLDIIS